MEKNLYAPTLLNFSVAMSVYKNDNPDYLKIALSSICTQSYPAEEIYLVIDGPIEDNLQTVINEFANKYSNFTINQLAKNEGLGNALKIAVENCRNDLIMRMDSDDISAPGRFKKMITAYIENPTDVLGSWTLGFIESMEKGKVSVAKKKLTHAEIVASIGKRSPMSHVTVLFKKNAVINAGNYKDLYYHEDYYLWARMIQAGCTFRNIPEYLVYVRLGQNQSKRHGGWKYFKAELFLRKYLLKNKIINLGCYFKETFIRMVYQLLITPKFRNYLAMKYKRHYITSEEVKKIMKRNEEMDNESIQR